MISLDMHAGSLGVVLYRDVVVGRSTREALQLRVDVCVAKIFTEDHFPTLERDRAAQQRLLLGLGREGELHPVVRADRVVVDADEVMAIMVRIDGFRAGVLQGMGNGKRRRRAVETNSLEVAIAVGGAEIKLLLKFDPVGAG